MDSRNFCKLPYYNGSPICPSNVVMVKVYKTRTYEAPIVVGAAAFFVPRKNCVRVYGCGSDYFEEVKDVRYFQIMEPIFDFIDVERFGSA